MCENGKRVAHRGEKGRKNMNSYNYLLDLALILLSTKVFGLLTRKVRMPQVVGALLAGLLLGPACFGILKQTEFIHEGCDRVDVLCRSGDRY